MRRVFLFTLTCVTTLMPFTAVAAKGEQMDFVTANQCRSQPDDAKRIECYDKAVTPTRTKTLEKFESRDQCREEVWEKKRLSCYDRFFYPIFTNAKVDKVHEDSRDVGNWKVDIQTSLIDDSKNVVIFVNGNDSFKSWFEDNITPTLYIACRENKTELSIDWYVHLGLQSEITMTHRIDKQKAINREWYIATNTRAVFYSGDVIDFIRKLQNGNQLFAQVTPYREDPVSTTFNLNGLSDVIKPLQESCNWK
ncbi:TPA: type VI secretion protein [Escherichia coli]|uniref:type VI secretion system-associated protein TagO n=1 Tax=Escherichia coli TaxID=562 RepID=UPI00107F234E|nr:type VI secretion system-associated protein TagO [Escherichia coli]EEY3892971.1 type VI secretion protein [Escherichia coli]EFE9641445.1 type VI secretion protein [Escherichia coli]EFH3708664.1 type VI secretion protein [Escherichia coli]EFM6373733.1 type VI secretion protein [Escherichia coli]EFM6387975.1 type VI secretion protein [Escherichia coli]